MIEYRKDAFVDREFFRLDGNSVVRVLNKLMQSRVDVVESSEIIRDLATDPNTTIPCTESEFNEAYKVAFNRIKEMKI